MADTKVGDATLIDALADADELPVADASDATAVVACSVAQIKAAIYDRYFIRADVDRTLPNDTNLNALFNDPANGRLTLATGVYKFEGLFIITAMSSTSNNALINIRGAGTATIGSWMWRLSGIDNSTPGTLLDDDSSYFQVEATAAACVTAGTGTALRLYVKGSFEVTAGGTLIPSIDLANAAAAIVQDGSYFQVERLGASGLISIGPWD